MNLYDKYKNLNIDTTPIGLSRNNAAVTYFCTPVNAEIIGWDNCIHFCFLPHMGEMVFAVNPESCCPYYVYPVARNFQDFLGLILATKGSTAIEQIILWDEDQYSAFINSSYEVANSNRRDVKEVLHKLHVQLGVQPIKFPFSYVKHLQKDFDYDLIIFSDDYYKAIGEEPTHKELG